MKRVIVVLLVGAAGFAAWRQWSQRRREAALWAEATDRV
jgi:predicted negative regulator of RcsB-dependent stress response